MAETEMGFWVVAARQKDGNTVVFQANEANEPK
eukprot:COSAG02_NODE_2330_length_9119_cov_11.886918_4_plen_33_part_00